jgi:phage baseplate assembly protein gpV
VKLNFDTCISWSNWLRCRRSSASATRSWSAPAGGQFGECVCQSAHRPCGYDGTTRMLLAIQRIADKTARSAVCMNR